jgi:hypothetical protein
MKLLVGVILALIGGVIVACVPLAVMLCIGCLAFVALVVCIKMFQRRGERRYRLKLDAELARLAQLGWG